MDTNRLFEALVVGGFLLAGCGTTSSETNAGETAMATTGTEQASSRAPAQVEADAEADDEADDEADVAVEPAPADELGETTADASDETQWGGGAGW